jgi:hypothetical protein
MSWNDLPDLDKKQAYCEALVVVLMRDCEPSKRAEMISALFVSLAKLTCEFIPPPPSSETQPELEPNTNTNTITKE